MHDIRARREDRTEATTLLKHADSKVTMRHYRRKLKRVKAKQNTILALENADSIKKQQEG